MFDEKEAGTIVKKIREGKPFPVVISAQKESEINDLTDHLRQLCDVRVGSITNPGDNTSRATLWLGIVPLGFDGNPMEYRDLIAGSLQNSSLKIELLNGTSPT